MNKLTKQQRKFLDDDDESLTEPTSVEVWLSDFIEANPMKKIWVRDAYKNYTDWLDTIKFTEDRPDIFKFKGEVKRRCREMGYEKINGRMRNHSNAHAYWMFFEKNEATE